MGRREGDATPVGDALGAVLKRIDPDEHLRVYQLWPCWAEAVGELIARRARPTHVRNGVLVVTVATHAWMQELRFLKESIRQRLNTRLSADLIRDVQFVVGPLEVEPSETRSPEAIPRGRGLVSVPAIDDPDLAAAFARVLNARAERIARAHRTKRS